MADTRFEILGPVRGTSRRGEFPLPAGREQILLAVLLLHAGDQVPVERLVDAIWGDRPPRDARGQVQGCVSRLRKRLAAADVPDVIVTGAAGYGIRVDPGQVDLWEFRRLVTQARAAAAGGDPAQARDRYRAALQLWHGPALAGVDSDLLRRTALTLEEERLRAHEECLEVELALGGAGELVPELTELVAAHPYRERLHSALMRALDRGGRHADALAHYRRVRAALRDELGTEPGPELQQRHRTILNREQDPDTGLPRGERNPDTDGGPDPTGGQPGQQPVPRELPPEVSSFVGRTPELARLAAVLAPAAPPRRRPAVAVVYGPGGVGKSALAVRAGHEVASGFPDGQLYLDLFGSTPGMRPLPVAEALGRLLRSLGVHPSEVPSDAAAAAALLRGVTADRRLLLVLDNAAERNQVAPLLPSVPGCAVLVTSRRPMPTLDADLRLRLGPLPEPDALALLAGLTGDRALDPESTRRIVAYSEGLPLAVRVAGARLAARPDLAVPEYADRLADDSRRLDELQVDDLAVRACFRTGYDALPGDPAGRLAARAFRALGMLHVPDVALGVVAAMLAEPEEATARTALDRLVDAQLVEPVAGGRYRLHDLVRLVAAERAADEDTPADRDQTLHRALTYYTVSLLHAEAMLDPDLPQPFGSPPLPAGLPLPWFSEPQQARRWLEHEHLSLTAALEQILTANGEMRRMSLWLGSAVWNRLDVRCEWRAAHRLSKLLLESAQRHDEHELVAAGLLLLGRSEACFGRYDSAVGYLERALQAWRNLDNYLEVVLALIGLGVVETRRGRQATALSYYRQALDIVREPSLANSGRLTPAILSNMCVSHALLGDVSDAVRAGEQCLTWSTADGTVAPYSVFTNLAAVHCLRGDQVAAVKYADESAAFHEEAGTWPGLCDALIIRSEANRRRGRLASAVADADEALSFASVRHHRFAVAAAHRQRARIFAELGRGSEAVDARAMADKAYTELAGTFREPLIEFLLSDGERQPVEGDR